MELDELTLFELELELELFELGLFEIELLELELLELESGELLEFVEERLLVEELFWLDDEVGWELV